MKKFKILIVVLVLLVCGASSYLYFRTMDKNKNIITPKIELDTAVTDAIKQRNTNKPESDLNKTDKVEKYTNLAGLNISDFSLISGNKHISVMDSVEDEVLKFAGKPLSEKEEVLGENADTYKGSYIKNLKFDGLEVILFSSKGEEKQYWVMKMKTNKPNFSTKRGTKVGDSIRDLKNKYPGISPVLDGRTDNNNCAYKYEEGEPGRIYNYITFEVKGGVVKEIYLENELP